MDHREEVFISVVQIVHFWPLWSLCVTVVISCYLYASTDRGTVGYWRKFPSHPTRQPLWMALFLVPCQEKKKKTLLGEAWTNRAKSKRHVAGVAKFLFLMQVSACLRVHFLWDPSMDDFCCCNRCRCRRRVDDAIAISPRKSDQYSASLRVPFHLTGGPTINAPSSISGRNTHQEPKAKKKERYNKTQKTNAFILFSRCQD